MTDQLRKAAEMLMKALDDGWVERGDNVAIALRQALAQPEQSKYSDIVSDGGLDPRNKFDAQQEPVAVIGNWGRVEWAEGVFPQLGDKMYAAPPNREWVGLTDEERDSIARDAAKHDWHDYIVISATEAALRSKNNG